MNVTGTPDAPRVSFDLDMPTLSNDAKQMVASVINAEEEMNQQVFIFADSWSFLHPKQQ